MKKKSIQIEIPQPCHEKWNEMTPIEKGNFCMSCQKVVVDFSTQSDREIGQFFKQSKGNVCGRFRPNQLNRQIPLVPVVSGTSQKAWAAMFSGLLLTAGASAQTNPTVEVTRPRVVLEVPITGMIAEVETKTEQPSPQRCIKGVVMDAEYNEPLIGANVLIFNRNIGTVTDFDGSFELLIPDNLELRDLALEVSYIGYENKYINGDSFSENMVIELLVDVFVIPVSGVVITTYRDQTLWQSGRRLWNRLQYNNPIRNWIENQNEKKALKKQEKAVRKEATAPTIETTDSHTKKGEVYIQNMDNAAFDLVNISPNPFHSKVSLDIEMLDAGEVTMSLFTEDGKRVFDRTDALKEGRQAIQLDVLASNLVAGTYILNLFHENGFQKSEVLILQ